MKAARIGVAAAAVLAACGFALAQADARAADDLRQRAEDLARAASERFDAYLRPQHIAQVQDQKAVSTRRDGSKDIGESNDAWSLANDWIERSGREYQGLMQRLAQASDSKGQAAPAKKDAAEVKSQTAPAAKAREDASDWLTYSSERFQWLMHRLAERAAPPDAVAEAERRRILQMQSATKKDTDETGKPKLLPGPTDKTATSEGTKATETAKTDEERRLAETRRAEAAKRAEEVRKTEEALKIEQSRKIADAKKIDEAAQKADEAKKASKLVEAKGTDNAKKAEDAAKVDEARKTAEAKQAEEAAKEQGRKLADVKKLEDAGKAKQAEETAKAEQALKAAQAKQAEDAAKAEQARKQAEVKKAEDARREDAAKTEQLKKATDAKKAEDDERKRVEERRLAKEKAEGDSKRAAELAARLAEEKRLAEQTARALDHVAASKLAKSYAERTTEPIRKEDLKEGDFKQTEIAKTETKKAAESNKVPAKKPEKRIAMATTPTHARGHRASRTCEAAGQDVSLGNWYVVKSGDTLWDIAQRHYHAGWRYKRIFASNRRTISNPHWIMPCQRLYIPALSRRA
jgi:nucleoid-associated protein YgaU